MREFFKTVLHRLQQQPVMLVSLLAAGGSTPRRAGAMMAVFPDGESCGTIGGGNVEYEAQKRSAELLAKGENEIRDFRFVPGDASGVGMVCGGDVTVHFQSLPAGDPEGLRILGELLEALSRNENAWLVRRLDGSRVTAMEAAEERDGQIAGLTGEKPSGLLADRPVLTTGEPRWFSVPVSRAGRVYLFGGGHVSRELAAVLARSGFRTVVFDDRPEFADPAQFPGAEQVLCGDFRKLSERLRITEDDYVVVVTRGHEADYEVLTQTLRSGAKYLGCIGSRRKLALCRERLLAAGFTPEEYDRLHAPIGLRIGAETPAEIAVAVAAELIGVRSGAVQ